MLLLGFLYYYFGNPPRFFLRFSHSFFIIVILAAPPGIPRRPNSGGVSIAQLKAGLSNEVADDSINCCIAKDIRDLRASVATPSLDSGLQQSMERLRTVSQQIPVCWNKFLDSLNTTRSLSL